MNNDKVRSKGVLNNMTHPARRNIPNFIYSKIARFEAERASELESEGDMGDPREVLQRTLIKAGIDPSIAAVVCLDVGYHTTIDDDYLANLGITKLKDQNIIYREVIRFLLRSLSA
jgi:hypothetical protein